MPFELDSLGRTENKATLHVWLETCALYIGTVVLCMMIRPDDPFFTEAGTFPWPIVAPLLSGIRYGFSQAFASAVLMILTSFAFAKIFSAPQWIIGIAYSVGLLVCAMLVGEFRDIWERRLRKLERSNEYRQARLDEFTRAYHVLKISHDRLEQESAGQLNSLRSAMFDLQAWLSNMRPGSKSLQHSAEKIMTILSHYGVLQLASLHAIEDGSMCSDALFSIGDQSSVDPSDPLIQRALRDRQLHSVRMDSLATQESVAALDYVACLPLVDSSNQLHALVVIKQMPFFSFQETTLKLLAIIAGRIADILMSAADGPVLVDDGHFQFMRHLKRSLHDARHFQLEATLISITATNDATAHAYITSIQNEMRGLDVGFVQKNSQHQQTLIILMPITPPSGLSEYLIRFEKFIFQQHGVGVDDAHINVKHAFIGPDTRASEVYYFLATEALLSQQAMNDFDFLQEQVA